MSELVNVNVILVKKGDNISDLMEEFRLSDGRELAEIMGAEIWDFVEQPDGYGSKRFFAAKHFTLFSCSDSLFVNGTAVCSETSICEPLLCYMKRDIGDDAWKECLDYDAIEKFCINMRDEQPEPIKLRGRLFDVKQIKAADFFTVPCLLEYQCDGNGEDFDSWFEWVGILDEKSIRTI